MNYYIAIDHTTKNPKPWSYMKIESGYNEKLTVRDVRNWLIRHMKDFENVWCIHIMKRTKKDTYESIEYVNPDCCSYDMHDRMGHVCDFFFNESNTVRI